MCTLPCDLSLCISLSPCRPRAGALPGSCCCGLPAIGPFELHLQSHPAGRGGCRGLACLGGVVQFMVLSLESREAPGAQNPLLHAQGQLCLICLHAGGNGSWQHLCESWQESMLNRSWCHGCPTVAAGTSFDMVPGAVLWCRALALGAGVCKLPSAPCTLYLLVSGPC